jgi:glycosyltransferase involved in cell wall biosynthesis
LRVLGTPLYTLGGTRLRNPIHVVELARLIRLHNIDVVHTHLGSANTMGSAAGALARRPVVSTLHNIRDVYPRFGPIKQSLQNQALRWWARAIIACAPEVREVGIRRLRLPAHKLVDVPNGIDTAAYIADPTAIEACRAAALAGLAGPLVVAVGNLRPAKGHEYLIEAAANLRDYLPGLRVLIAGRSDPHEGYLRARITALNLEHHVTLAGQRDDVPALLGAADLFVQSSILEGLPLSLLEAMAAGVPVVATAVGGMPRLVKDGVTGRLIPPDDSEALAAAMLDILHGPERARRMADTAQDRVRRTYGVRVWADRLEHIYDEITMTNRPGVHSGTIR